MSDDEYWAVRAELAAREEEIATLRGAVAALRAIHQKEAGALNVQEREVRRWVSTRVVTALFAGGILGALGTTAAFVAWGAPKRPTQPSASAQVLAGRTRDPDRDSGTVASGTDVSRASRSSP
jgi:hypothetical protein